jgi:uncharacterized protein (DUF1697 family)
LNVAFFDVKKLIQIQIISSIKIIEIVGNIMKPYVALFRGINVGGHSTLPMKTLTSILEDLGAVNVKTYINSGNAVFQISEENLPFLPEKIINLVKQKCGFAPHVLLLSMAEFEKAMNENPFPEMELFPANLHLGFLASKPENPNFVKIDSLKSESERYRLTENMFYLCAPDGIGRSKLASNIEKILGVPMTDRNWRTVCKIREMYSKFTS